MRILDVHNLITDVIGCLYHIHQRVAGVPQRFAFGRQAADAQFIGNFLVSSRFGRKKAEFTVVASQTAGKRIFHDGGKHRISHHKSTLATALEAVRQDSEAVGITLVMGDIIPKLR